MARKQKKHTRRPHHPVHHGHVPQHHGAVERTHSHGPATQDFHFDAAQEQAMREGNGGGMGGPPMGGGEPAMDDMG